MKSYEDPHLCRDQRDDNIVRPIVIERACDSYMIQKFNGSGYGWNGEYARKVRTSLTSYRGNV